MKNGKGTYYYGENSLKGIWKNNLPHGEGEIKSEDKKIKGEFRYGKLIRYEIIKDKKNDKKHSHKKEKKHKKSSDNASHHRKSKHSNTNKSDKKNKEEKNKEKEENNNLNLRPVEIDCIPGICSKKIKTNNQ